MKAWEFIGSAKVLIFEIFKSINFSRCFFFEVGTTCLSVGINRILHLAQRGCLILFLTTVLPSVC